MRSLEKHESMGEEPDHCVKNRKCNRRGKELREQSTEGSGKGATLHHRGGGDQSEADESRLGAQKGEAPRKPQDYYVNRDVLRW